MAVFVLDTQGQALMPCTEKRARLLLARGRARVHRLVPMVIRLVDRTVDTCAFQPLRLKLDPGSNTTGLALVRDTQVIDRQTGEVQTAAVVLNLMELIHRGKQISEALTARRHMRRRRRSQLRHRAPRFLNRGNKKSGWFAPSLQHRIATCMASALQATSLPVELASGGQTKFNRCTRGIPKTHALDAACVGTLQAIENWQCPTLTLKATGRGSYQRTRLNKFGFPRGYLLRSKRVHGFGTGDLVRVEVPAGVKAGTYTGRVAIRASGSFNIQSYQDGKSVVVQGIRHKHCRVIQRADGYGYFFNRANNTQREQARPKARNEQRSALCLPGMHAGASRAT